MCAFSTAAGLLLATTLALGEPSASTSPGSPRQGVPGRPAAPSTPLPATITLHGVVLDDSLNLPVPDARLYIAGTKYGAVTNAQGEFTLTFSPDWRPVRGGVVVLNVLANVWLFRRKVVPFDWRTGTDCPPIRLPSAPGRGRRTGQFIWMMALPIQPPAYPTGAHLARPRAH